MFTCSFLEYENVFFLLCLMKINLVFCSLCSKSSFRVHFFFFFPFLFFPIDAQQPPTLYYTFASVLDKAARRTQNFYTWIKINCISRRWTLASVTLLIIPIHRVVVKWTKERVLTKVNNYFWFYFCAYFRVSFAPVRVYNLRFHRN